MGYISERQSEVVIRVIFPPGEKDQLEAAKAALSNSGVRDVLESDHQLEFLIVPEPLEKHRDRLKKPLNISLGASP